MRRGLGNISQRRIKEPAVRLDPLLAARYAFSRSGDVAEWLKAAVC